LITGQITPTELLEMKAEDFMSEAERDKKAQEEEDRLASQRTDLGRL